MKIGIGTTDIDGSITLNVTGFNAHSVMFTYLKRIILDDLKYVKIGQF